MNELYDCLVITPRGKWVRVLLRLDQWKYIERTVYNNPGKDLVFVITGTDGQEVEASTVMVCL